MLQEAKTHAIPLGNHMTQKKLNETAENRSALTKIPNFGIFRLILLYPLYLGVIPPHSAVNLARSGIFQNHSCSLRFVRVLFRLIPAYSGLFWYIPFRSVPFQCLVTPTDANPTLEASENM